MLQKKMTVNYECVQDELTLHNKLTAMYRQLPNVLIFTFVTTSALTLYFHDRRENHLWLWWSLFQAVTLLRLVGFHWWQINHECSEVVIRRFAFWFASSSLVTGCLWAYFSISYFPGATSSQRMVISLVMSTIASGSVNVLSLMPWVNRLFSALLIGPLIILFAQSGAPDDWLVAGLGVTLFIGLTGFSRVAGRNLLDSFLMAQGHRQTIISVFSQRDDLVKTKAELEERVKQQINTLKDEIELRERYAQDLKKIIEQDLRTGLLNRRSFDEQLQQLLQQLNLSSEGVGFLAIEILNFDVVEMQGTSISDQVLITLSDRLKNFLPSQALLAFWGGAEFYVAVSQKTIKTNETFDLIRYATLLNDVLQQPIATYTGQICVDALVGATSFPNLAANAENLFYQSVVAKHSLRRLGVGGVRIFDPKLDASLRERHYLRHALLQAVQTNSLTLAFQPLVPSSIHQPYKMEALLRWNSAEFGQVSPAVFIPIAEESGLIVPLGRWVLNTACNAAMNWPDNCVVCVNVSVHQILTGNLQTEIKSALEQSGLAPERLEVEITESVFAQDIAYISAELESVRSLGVGLAIDDFGTGYSSLAYLLRLPVNTIKIDRSFIAEIDHCSRKLLFSIVAMARGLGFQIVAEGVETYEQQDLLLALGVDYLQGYLLSKPLPQHPARDWLQTSNLKNRNL